ncbi:MAG: glycosyltransferase family 2 protein [Bacteroidetes bacterium]|nr:glycosyltransferase family 2 protein [Bacteroidota bacterium]
MAKLPISVAIISFNEEKNISRTLASVVELASEIIIVDSHSTDQTQAIAEEFGAKVFTEDWKGHIAQKNSAIQKCTQEWILCLDCDEVVTPLLLRELTSAILDLGTKGWKINRRTVYLNKVLKYAWQPDRKLRLVRRNANPTWGGYNPHDVLFIDGKTSELKGELLHYSYRDIRQHFEKTIYYAYHTAVSYHENGKKPSVGKLLFNPTISFIRNYIFQRGFLDGIRGFIAAISAFVYVFLKYAFLWEMKITNKE